MGSVFDYIKNFISNHTEKTYGDLLIESNGNEKERNSLNEKMLEQFCSNEEYEEYLKMKTKDYSRFNKSINESANIEEKHENPYIQNMKRKKVEVFGIGEVEQIC